MTCSLLKPCHSCIEASKYIPEIESTLFSTFPSSVNEKINHPDHYKGNKFEVIDIIDDFDLNFCLGNAIKYILRAGKKDDRIQDLKKAIWYINREIQEKNTT